VARKTLVDLGDPVGTAVRLVRLVRREDDRLFELAERARDKKRAYRILALYLNDRITYEEAEERLKRLLGR